MKVLAENTEPWKALDKPYLLLSTLSSDLLIHRYPNVIGIKSLISVLER